MNHGKEDAAAIIEKARRSFDEAFAQADYDQVLIDDPHLQLLLELVAIAPGDRLLDLGTGNGYVAFAAAKHVPDASITGLDIAAKTIEENTRRSGQQRFENLRFVSFDGLQLPFDDAEFSSVVCRYAFHHFPDAAWSVGELSRVLQPEGSCIIADPVPHSDDNTDFINRLAAIRDDGHVRFRRSEELHSLFGEAGFVIEQQLLTDVTFPREWNERYAQLIEQTPDSILQAYNVRRSGGDVLVTVDVLNTRFRRV